MGCFAASVQSETCNSMADCHVTKCDGHGDGQTYAVGCAKSECTCLIDHVDGSTLSPVVTHHPNEQGTRMYIPLCSPNLHPICKMVDCIGFNPRFNYVIEHKQQSFYTGSLIEQRNKGNNSYIIEYTYKTIR